MTQYFKQCINIFGCSVNKEDIEREMNIVPPIQMNDNSYPSSFQKENDNTVIIRGKKIHIDGDFMK